MGKLLDVYLFSRGQHNEFNKVIVPKDDWHLREALTFDGRAKRKDWNTIEVVDQLGTFRKRQAQIMTFAPGPTCILTEKAVELLYETIVNDTELLPVTYKGQTLWLMYVTTVLDCVNFEKSTVVYTLNGKVSHFKRIVFDEHIINNHTLFLIKQTAIGPTYATAQFKDQVEALDANALKFKLVFNSDE